MTRFDQKKIITILFFSAVAILLINVLLEKLFLKNNTDKNIEISTAAIDSAFHQALFNVGISDDWIKKQKGVEPRNFTVKIPNDLPIVVVIREMNIVFDTNSVKVKAVEKKISGRTIINFVSGGKEKLKASLVYNNNVKRKSVRIGFIVNRTVNDIETDTLLLQYPEQFAFALIPSKNSAEFVKRILMNRKEYIIYLNDEIDELKFKLSSDYSPVRLKNSVREIVGTFPNAVFFLIDDKSNLFNSSVYPLLKEELEKRKIKLIPGSSFINLSSSGKENSDELFNSSVKNLKNSEDKVYFISAEDFLSLNSELIACRKLGYKFTNPSALLFN